MPQSFWDKSKAFYRDAKGKEIAYKTVRASVDAVADEAKATLRALYNNKTSISDWVTKSESLLKKLYGATAQIASGGKDQMTPSLNGQLGAKVKFHLSHFKQFWLQVEKGELSEAAILARLDQYANASVGVFEQMRGVVMVAAGYTQARNILHSKEPCKECPSLSAQGWIDADAMPMPGARICKSNCKCEILWR